MVGLTAGLIAVAWLFWTEFLLHGGANSWIALNIVYTEEFPITKEIVAFAKLKILAVLLVTIAVAHSLLRSVAARISFRQVPLSQRTWPAFAAGVICIVVWFAYSVTHTMPLYFDIIKPEFRIVHVEKRGLHLHETGVDVYTDGKACIWRNDRRLFQYQFKTRVAVVSLTELSGNTLERARTILKSLQLQNVRPRPVNVLRSWNTDAWYIVLQKSAPLAFGAEYQTVPPEEAVKLFDDIENLRVKEEQFFPVRDICLGFCYDPITAL